MVGLSGAPVFVVLVLTEDGSAHASATIEQLVKKLFRYLDPQCQTQKIRFEPGNKGAREILSANQFKSPRHRHRQLLYRYIATQLMLDDRFIVHHVDADRRWSERVTNASENVAAVQRDLLTHVCLVLRQHSADIKLEPLMTRFISLVPYWELEASLYQNTERALHLGRHASGCRCAELLTAWRADRSLLDDVVHPSDQLCLGKRHIDALLTGYPTADVVAASTSLAAAVNNLLECHALLHALERTYQSSPSSPDPGTQPA